MLNCHLGTPPGDLASAGGIMAGRRSKRRLYWRREALFVHALAGSALLMAGCSEGTRSTPVPQPSSASGDLSLNPVPTTTTKPEEPNSAGDDAVPLPDLGTAPRSGLLRVSVTDDPFPRDVASEVLVTFGELRGRVEGSLDLADGWYVLGTQTRTVNLLPLRNGVKEELLLAAVPPGSWSEFRLIVESARITLTDGRVFDLKVPSGAASGLKIKPEPAVLVVGGLSAELLLDFDLDDSFVVQGNPRSAGGIKGFLFKPVLRPGGSGRRPAARGGACRADSRRSGRRHHHDRGRRDVRARWCPCGDVCSVGAE